MGFSASIVTGTAFDSASPSRKPGCFRPMRSFGTEREATDYVVLRALRRALRTVGKSDIVEIRTWSGRPSYPLGRCLNY